jgi:hypothetical protein
MRDLFLALVGLAAGRKCRSCSEEILRDDQFGLSEGICHSCRV